MCHTSSSVDRYLLVALLPLRRIAIGGVERTTYLLVAIASTYSSNLPLPLGVSLPAIFVFGAIRVPVFFLECPTLSFSLFFLVFAFRPSAFAFF